jgi:hypothetical protein
MASRLQTLFVFILTMSVGSLLPAAKAPRQAAVELPTVYAEHRFFVTPVTPTGETLRLYTDSGGGLFLLDGAVKRLGLPVKTEGEGQEKAGLVRLPAFRPGASIPPPLANDGRLVVLPAGQEKSFPEKLDGMLGQAWFSGRVWTWDYPGRRLLWRPDGGLPAVAQATV